MYSVNHIHTIVITTVNRETFVLWYLPTKTVIMFVITLVTVVGGDKNGDRERMYYRMSTSLLRDTTPRLSTVKMNVTCTIQPYVAVVDSEMSCIPYSGKIL